MFLSTEQTIHEKDSEVPEEVLIPIARRQVLRFAVVDVAVTIEQQQRLLTELSDQFELQAIIAIPTLKSTAITELITLVAVVDLQQVFLRSDSPIHRQNCHLHIAQLVPRQPILRHRLLQTDFGSL